MNRLLTGAVLLALLAPQQPTERPAPRATARSVVIGASLSAGFGLQKGFAAAFEASLAGAHEPVRAHATEFFFLDALHTGPEEVEAAADDEPSLVLAIDFLFWFGYGTFDAQGGPIENEDERLALLDKGLALLAGLECPLVVADFPDMSAAIGTMLVAAQVPEVATLARLSKRVREWAAPRPNVIVLPFAELVKQLNSSAKIQLGRHEFAQGNRLLQPDHLHPTLEGEAAVAQLVADELVQRKLAREEEFDFDWERVLAKLGEPEPASAGTRPGTSDRR